MDVSLPGKGVAHRKVRGTPEAESGTNELPVLTNSEWFCPSQKFHFTHTTCLCSFLCLQFFPSHIFVCIFPITHFCRFVFDVLSFSQTNILGSVEVHCGFVNPSSHRSSLQRSMSVTLWCPGQVLRAYFQMTRGETWLTIKKPLNGVEGSWYQRTCSLLCSVGAFFELTWWHKHLVREQHMVINWDIP